MYQPGTTDHYVENKLKKKKKQQQNTTNKQKKDKKALILNWKSIPLYSFFLNMSLDFSLSSLFCDSGHFTVFKLIYSNILMLLGILVFRISIRCYLFNQMKIGVMQRYDKGSLI